MDWKSIFLEILEIYFYGLEKVIKPAKKWNNKDKENLNKNVKHCQK